MRWLRAWRFCRSDSRSTPRTSTPPPPASPGRHPFAISGAWLPPPWLTSSLGGVRAMTKLPKVAGGIEAYEFYVEMELGFRCGDCDERLDCPVLDSDADAPHPPWATREGRRGMSL